jgi:predicted HicB family RNase H-like nuclease
MKICSKCKIEKSQSEFYKDIRHADGLYSWCKSCCKENKESKKEQYSKIQKIWTKNNLHKKAANEAKRRAAKLQRTVSWANLDKIKEIYKNCPDGYEVDHIIPLQGKNVSGLHVEYNLQYLTVSENCSKKNRFL